MSKKSLLSLIFFLLVLVESKAQKAKDVDIVKFEDLENLINSDQKNIRVVNFWATWCKPCIKELPYFEKLNKNYSNENVEVTLVSLDFVENLEGKVKTFLKKKSIQSEVVLLDETDFDKFINKVDPTWSGAIPATLIVDNRNGKKLKAFYEKEFHEGEIDKIIQNYLN